MSSLGESFFKELKKFYHAFVDKKILKTAEEVAANTNEHNLASAVVVGEIYNNLLSVTDGGAIKGLDAREDGVYITYVPADGADAVTKKLGNNIDSITLVASNTIGTDTHVSTSYTAQKDGECIICMFGHNASISTNGTTIMDTGAIRSGGAHFMRLTVIKLSKNQYASISAWQNVRIYKLI